MPDTAERDLIKVGDVARQFNVSTETIRNWVKRNKLAAIKTPTGQLRFDRAYIEAQLRGDAA